MMEEPRTTAPGVDDTQALLDLSAWDFHPRQQPGSWRGIATLSLTFTSREAVRAFVTEVLPGSCTPTFHSQLTVEEALTLWYDQADRDDHRGDSWIWDFELDVSNTLTLVGECLMLLRFVEVKMFYPLECPALMVVLEGRRV